MTMRNAQGRLDYGDFTERRLSEVVLYVEHTADL